MIPTKNRSNFLKKQIDRCKKNFNGKLYNYIIIDASNDDFHLKNKKIVKNIKNIKLFRQRSRGIQKGCFESLKFIKTKYVSFLYDDDELSKNITKIHKKNFNDGKTFSFGYGIVKDLSEKVSFRKLEYTSINAKDILLSYNGLNINNFLKIKDLKYNIILPLSPICTSYELNFLTQWKHTVLNFVKNNKFRNFFLLEKEIGPDLLIYLMLVARSKKKINFFTPFVAKFSSHEKSISVIYGSNLLRIGYWLSRVCFFEKGLISDKTINDKIYTYLVLTGAYLLFFNIFRPFFFKNIFIELFKIIHYQPFNFSFNYLKIIIFNRFKK